MLVWDICFSALSWQHTYIAIILTKSLFSMFTQAVTYSTCTGAPWDCRCLRSKETWGFLAVQAKLHFASPRMRGQGQCYSGYGEGRSRKSWNGELGEDEACFSFSCWEGRRDGNGTCGWGTELSSSGSHFHSAATMTVSLVSKWLW